MDAMSNHRALPASHLHVNRASRPWKLILLLILLVFSGLWAADVRSALAQAPIPPSGVKITPTMPELWRLMPDSTDASVCGNASWVNPTNNPQPNASISVNLLKNGSKRILDTPLGKLDFGGGNIAYAFCTDIYHSRAYNRNFCLDSGFFSDWRVAWIVTHYPPTLNDAIQQAARQAAVWLYTDGWSLDQADATLYNSSYDAAVRNAYNAILAAVPANPPVEYQPGNIQLVVTPASTTGFLPYQPVHSFTVRLTKGAYPLAGYTVTVATTYGSLDKTSAVTDSNGEAAFTLTSALPGSATITASAVVDLPAGSRFIDQVSPDTWQRLVLGQMTRVKALGQATHTWERSDNLIIAHKFEDKNFDGIQQEDEPSLANWNFTLTTPGGQFSAATDANGNAFFSGVIIGNGSYVLTETLQSGWSSSTPQSQTRTRSAADAWTQWRADFGNGQYSILEILKFLDLDGDGVWDSGQEPPLPGWQFALYMWKSGDWAQHRGGTTGADGRLFFTDLVSGQYKVVEQAANHPGYTNTTPLEQVVTLGYPVRMAIRFGNRGTLAISGLKFNDRDANGVRDAGEPLLSGWTIRLTGGPHPVNVTATTGVDGRYTFANLEPGSYTVSEIAQGGWAQTWPGGAGSQSVTLVDHSVSGVDFGNTELACLGDYVWLDQNRNGIQDAGEVGVPDAKVELFKQINGVWVSQGARQTDGSGHYQFCDLIAGTYRVRFYTLDGYMITVRDQGSDDTADSDADPGSGDTISITLRSGEHQFQWDAGLNLLPAIDVEKYVSVDSQATWEDADLPPGPRAAVGAPVYFRFVVTNVGKVPLTNVTLSDNVYALADCHVPDPLAPGQSYTCFYGPVPAQLGQHTDTATATGLYVNIQVRDADDANYYVPSAPAIDVEKFVSVDDQATWQDADTPPGPETSIGNKVYFRFDVTNTGNVPLSDVTLSDNVYPLTGCAFPSPLDPGQSQTCWFGPVAAQGGQHTDTATVTGRWGATTVRDADDANYHARPLTATPTATSTPTRTATATATATSTPTASPTPTSTSTPTSTATRVPTNTPTPTQTPIPAAPAIDVEKFVSVDGQLTWQDADAPTGPQATGGVGVYFRFVVTNVGNVPLSSVTLSDNIYALSRCNTPSLLAPGQSYTCWHGPVAAQVGQHTNTATATGIYGGTTVRDTDDANYFGVARPAIDVEKYVSVDGQATWQDADAPTGPQTVVGYPVYFRFVVTNIGNVPLSDVVLGDSVYALGGCPQIPNPLAPGASYVCVYGPTPAQVGQHTDTATTSGIYDGVTVRDSDDANYIAQSKPTIDVEKLVSVDGRATWQDADAPPGPQTTVNSAVYFKFIVTNTGNVPLSDVTLADNVFDLSGCPSIPNPLPVGASYTCGYGPVSAQFGLHNNTATATGRYDGVTVSDTDDANYNVPSRPAIDVEKLVSVDGQVTWLDADVPPGPQTRVGDPVYFRFVVVNTGDIALYNVTLTDSVYPLSGCPAIPNPLLPGASYTCSYETVATDIENCVHTNTATATGAYDGGTVRDTDDASYFVPSRPAIDVEKLVSVDGKVTWHDADAAPGPETMVGSAVYFRFVIVNVGNVPLNYVTLSDNRYPLAACDPIPDPLALGQSYTCTIGPLPAQAGQHTNLATATGWYAKLMVQDADQANYIAASANASIGDLVWRDLDLDGVRDPGEPGIDGVLLELLDADGIVIATQVTAGGGLYLFDDLPAGSYRVRVAAANFDSGRPLYGFVFTSGAYGPNPYPVDLGADQNFLFADFGYARARVAITKRANPVQVLRGGNVTYTYEVSNLGDTWLDHLSVVDDRLGQICTSQTLGALGPGQKTWCTKTVSLAERACNIGSVSASAATAAGGSLQMTVQASSAQVCVDVLASLPRDYGDGPDPGPGTGVGNYETTASDNGPSHVIVPGLYLGRQAPDSDSGALQNAAADADDITSTDDEDGVAVLPIISTASGGVNVMMTAVNTTGDGATLACWIDFNRDGDFLDAGERASAALNSAAGRQSVNLTFAGFPVPTPGVSYLRCRIANAASEVALPTGPANSGEVEDTWITIINVGSCRPANASRLLEANEEPCPEVSINGLTWEDATPDGVYADEAVLSDVVLSVKNSQGERLAIVTTGPEQFLPGRYLVQSLPPGKYLVTVESWPVGYVPVEPRSRKAIVLTSGESITVDFAFKRQARLYIPALIREMP